MNELERVAEQISKIKAGFDKAKFKRTVSKATLGETFSKLGAVAKVGVIANALVDAGVLDMAEAADNTMKKILSGNKFLSALAKPSFKAAERNRRIARRLFSDKNDPRWYTNLEAHPNISLNAAYNKSFDVSILTYKTPLLVSHQLRFNPNFNNAMIFDKYQVFYNILKNKKSLNQVLYSKEDLFAYDVMCCGLVAIYSKMLFARSAYYTADLYNPKIARALLKSKGFNIPTDSTTYQKGTNYLNECLCLMYNKLCTIVGGCDFLEKVVHECTCLVSDCDIRSAATFHTFNWTSQDLGAYAGFDLPGIPSEVRDFNVLNLEFNRIYNILTSAEVFTTQASDRFFVQSTRLSDFVAPYDGTNPIQGIKLEDVRVSSQILEQIHNASTLEMSTLVNFLDNDGNVISENFIKFENKLHGDLINGYEMRNEVNIKIPEVTSATTVEVVIPNLNVNGYTPRIVKQNIDWSQATTEHFEFKGDHIISSPKESLTEGETFEILQYRANLNEAQITTNKIGSDYSVHVQFEYSTFASSIFSSAIYYLDSNNELRVEGLMNYVINEGSIGAEATKAQAIRELQLASMIDMMPFYSRLFVSYGSQGVNAGDDISTFDIEYLGKFPCDMFKQVTQYAQYSLTHQQGIVDGRKTSYSGNSK